MGGERIDVPPFIPYFPQSIQYSGDIHSLASMPDQIQMVGDRIRLFDIDARASDRGLRNEISVDMVAQTLREHLTITRFGPCDICLLYTSPSPRD